MPSPPNDKQSKYDIITGQDSYSSQTAQSANTSRRVKSMIPSVKGQMLRELAEPLVTTSALDGGSPIMAIFEYDHNNQNGTVTRNFFAVTASLKLYSLNIISGAATQITSVDSGNRSMVLAAVPQGVTSPTDGNFHLSDGTYNYLFDGTGWFWEGFHIPLSPPYVKKGSLKQGTANLTAYTPDGGYGTNPCVPNASPGAQVVSSGLNASNHQLLVQYAFGTATEEANVTSTGTDGQDFIVDNSGYGYLIDTSTPALNSINLNGTSYSSTAHPISFVSLGTRVASQSGLINIVDFNDRQYVFWGQDETSGLVGSGRCAIACMTRAGDGVAAFATVGTCYALPNSVTITGGTKVLAMTVDSHTGNIYVIAKDGPGNWWLTTINITNNLTNASFTAATEPTGGVQIYAAAANPSPVTLGTASRPGGIVYDGISRIIFIQSDGTLRAWNINNGAFETAVNRGSVNTSITAELMYCANDVGQPHGHLTQNSTFYIAHTNALSNTEIVEVTASSLAAFNTYDLVLLGLPTQFTLANLTGGSFDSGKSVLYLSAQTGGINYLESLSFTASGSLVINTNRYYWFTYADETTGRTHDSDSSPISNASGPVSTLNSPNANTATYAGGNVPGGLTTVTGTGFKIPVADGVQVAKAWEARIGQFRTRTDWGWTSNNAAFALPFAGFNLSVPTGSIIKSIEVDCLMAYQQTGVFSATTQLGIINNGNFTAIGPPISPNNPQTAASAGITFTFGGASSSTPLLGVTDLTQAMVSSVNFGVQFIITAPTTLHFFVNPPTMKVTYTTNNESLVVYVMSDGSGPSTASCTSGSTAVSGVANSLFTKQGQVGDALYINSTFIGTIATINSDTSITLNANAGSTITGGNYVIAPPRATNWHIWASESENSQVGLYLDSIAIATPSYTDTQPFLNTFDNNGNLVATKFLNINRPVRNDPPIASSLLTVHKRRLWRRQDSRLNWFTFSGAEEIQALSNGSPVESNPGVDTNTLSDIINADSLPDQSRFLRNMTSHADALYLGSEKNVVPLYGETIDDFGLSQVSAFGFGVAGRWAMASANAGLCFVTYDKKCYLYPTANYPWAYVPKDVNVTQNLIEIGKPIRDQLGNIKSSDLDNVRLAYYAYNVRNWLVLCYQDSNSAYHTWIYDFDTKFWFELQRGFTSVAVMEPTTGNQVLYGGGPDGNLYVIDDQTATYTNNGALPAATWKTALIDFNDVDVKHVAQYLEVELTNTALSGDLTVNFWLDPDNADNPTVPTRTMTLNKVFGSNLYRGFFFADGQGSVCQRLLIQFSFASSANSGGFRGIHLEAPRAATLIG